MNGTAHGKGPYRTTEIARWIRDEIESGGFRPGDRLEERPLSERFEVSKTPVREALIQLSSLGLVELRQRRGATVTRLNPEQIVSMFELMTELESVAAKLAAGRMSPDDLAEMAAIHQSSEDHVNSGEVAAYDALNRQFHERLYRGAGNPYLEAGIKDIRARLGVYRGFPFQKPGRLRQSFADHTRVLAALRAGDAEAAAAAMRHHISVGGQVFADLVLAHAREAASS